MYLSGAVSAALDAKLPTMAGWMLQPAMGNHPIGGRPWAADNGCFAAGSKFDVTAWLRWLEARRDYLATCLFAVAPDVVGDAAMTLTRSAPFLPMIRDLGYRASYVAQDGWNASVIDWDAFDCLFVGGSTAFKLSRAEELTDLAHRYGKWSHVGRVNSSNRFRAMAGYGVDSVDGTFLAFAPDKNTPRLERWFNLLRMQPALEGL